ncbi:MAG: dihydrodipicolinate synthase family protein [Dehalococcoidia bacterium]|nr:MAG: dihydrodipicolinate synthase family protein [Dehalococcoidia bacterium]
MPTVRGVFPPVPTIFDADGALDLDRFARNLSRWNTTGLAGYVVLGSNGEFALLDEREKLALIERAREVTPRDKLLIAGTAVESTRGTIALTRAAAALGADLAIVLTPHYYSPSYDMAAYVRHFGAVADASPIPILAYNMPSYAKVDLPASTLIALANHPNIVGYKESGNNVAKIAEVAAAAPHGFAPLAGSGSQYLPARLVGATGGIMSLAIVAPDACVDLETAIEAGDLPRAQALQRRLLALNNAVTTRFGIAGVKAALDLLGYEGGAPREPLAPLSDADRRELATVLHAAGLVVATT